MLVFILNSTVVHFHVYFYFGFIGSTSTLVQG